MKNKKIVIPGGSGFIGQELARHFGKDNEIVVLGRQSGDTHSNSYSQKLVTSADGYNIRYVKWDARNVEAHWAKELDGADLVINLTGKSVNCRYHAKQKQEIFDSRKYSTKAIGEAIGNANHPPTLWINAASATIYKNSLEHPNDEFTGQVSDLKKDNMPYNLVDHLRYKKNRLLARLKYGRHSTKYKDLELDFSIQVCKLWERVFLDEKSSLTRKVALRAAITLGKGGVMTPYLNLCKYGLGGKHGNGRQMFSWVHIEDLARMIEWLYENKNAEGVYNCVAPNVISNYSFMKTLRQVTGHKIGLPATSWMLEAGTFLIGTETELILKSRWVLATRAMNEGFVFKYPLLKAALTEIVSGLPRKKYHLF